ncbi:MAG: hypothetical protein RML46_09240 [Anaerolineae bacterium]|nr:hypothetical protein [Anaerolineae bacterium]
MNKPKLYVFRLYYDQDRDLIDWLDSIPPGQRAFHIRRILWQAFREKTSPHPQTIVDYGQIKVEVKAAVLEALEEKYPKLMMDIKAATRDAVEKALAGTAEEPRKRWFW